MTEIEGKLVVWADEADRVVEQIAALEEAAGYRLAPGPDLELTDAYFDTPGEELKRLGMALRVRDEVRGGRRLRLLTLKGDARSGEDALVERTEIERPWSEAALLAALDVLELRGAALPGPQAKQDRPPGPTAPEEILAGLGFRLIQRRRTLRRVRNVHRPAAAEAEPLAELAIDTVTFAVEGSEIHHHEVEAERKAAGGERAAIAVLRFLSERFVGRLRPWPHPKLAIGQALLALHRQGELPGMVDDRGNLLPRAYVRLASYLEPTPA
jgi:inorganic triphosphatase YgiF